jgi:hypothetical protein
VQEGVGAVLWAAVVAPADAVGGRYSESCHVTEIDDTTPMSGVRSYALDPAHAKRFWTKSEEMVNERF